MVLLFVTWHHSVPMWHQVLAYQRFLQHVPVYISQLHHITTATITAPLQSLLSLQEFSHFLVLFLSSLPQALHTTDCFSNWHPVLNTFFPCLLLFHFLVRPVRNILSHVHHRLDTNSALHGFFLACELSVGSFRWNSFMMFLYYVLSFRLMSRNKISQRWSQIIWSWKIFSLLPNQRWKFNHGYFNSFFIVHL